MGVYTSLIKYLDLFSNISFGEWYFDTQNDGTMEHPIQIPYVRYSPVVDDFINEVHRQWDQSGMSDYIQILKENNIEWDYHSMSRENYTLLDSAVILALLLAAVRAEKFCDGALLSFFKNNCIQNWLCELQKREAETTMKSIKLNDLLHFSVDAATRVKVKFNQPDGLEDPVELYLENPDTINTQWLFWRNKQRYFQVDEIAVCLLKLSDSTWLLTTIKKITKELNVLNGVNYAGEELEEYRQYFGRVIIKYHKSVQTQRMFYSTVCDQLEVLEILPTVFDGDEFPGYDNVCLSYAQLHTVIERQKKSWVTALENQKAVYVITDKHTGKLYVGSATADNGMLLSRWSEYVKNGHGGNVELKKLVAKCGFDYVKQHFQYAILENYNAKTDDSVILKRESWWKKTLQSISFGYNQN